MFGSGCFRHMTGNKALLIDYHDIDGGIVAFGGTTRGGKITGIGKIRTNKIDFEDVFFVKELNFNLFSISQMCNKKNSVLFTETECLVLSPDFKLIDESQVLLRVPRLDHVNFKTMNKLVKGNLVRGLPSKTFENDHTCVACQKGKQHKASSTKSETSGILKKFITEVENQLNHKVIVIRTNNGTKFKNREMDEFYGQKGIKREYSVARTPQQNGVAERKNRTLIEAARTMLADSLLPIVFWAEAVNTACYVLNRVLVTKPHNKTPFELIIDRAPRISFIIPFGCPVTILNTLDPLGKFDGKAVEGFLVGYSVNSRAFRVFNSKTRKVEENLHVNFLENKPNVAGQGPNWLFDIDSLTNSMNYQLKNVDAGQTEEENVSTQQYIVFLLWSSISSNYKSSDDKAKDDTVDDDACKKTIQEPANRKEFEAQCDSQLHQEKITRTSSTNSFNTVSTPVNTASATKIFSPIGPSSGPSFVPFGAEDDFNNMEPSTIISPIPTTRVHSTHPKDHIIGDPNWVEAMQEELLQFKIQNVWTLVDLHSSKKAIGTKWVYRNKKDKRGIVVRNKARLVAQGYKQQEGIDYDENSKQVHKVEKPYMVLPQAPRACIRHSHTYLLDNDITGTKYKTLFIKRLKGDILLVQVYVDDIIFGLTKKSLCDEFKQIMHNRFQMSSMGELTFFLGLQVKQKKDRIFISQDKYVGEILKKFGFSSIRTAHTLMETNKALTKDEDGEDVDVHLYRSMIGSLMYLTSSRPDIIYLKGQPKLGLWYPKDSPLILEAFSDIDYSGSSLDRKFTTGGCQFLGSRLISWQCKKQTVAKSHVDNESAIYVIKNPVYHSKTKHIEIGHHFIRDFYEKRLIEMVKIHIDYNVADLLTKAFDVRRFNFLVASIGRDTKIPLYGGPPIKVDDEVVHKESGDRMERVATTASSFEAEQDSEFYDKHNMVAYLQKSEGSEGFHQIIDFLNASHIQYALIKNPTIYVSFIKQFWRTATAGTSANGEVELTATIDGQVKTIAEASLRRHLKLEDNGGVTTLTNSEIFEELALMGRVKKLEHIVKASKSRRRARVVEYDDEQDLEDPSK
ncbi:putative ribonuclease H-like domain-containing protein [Tanacetum coccineum]